MRDQIPVAVDHLHSSTSGLTNIRFLGRQQASDPEQTHREHGARLSGCAFLEQVHSPRVVAARSGSCGRADGLWTDRAGLTLCIKTADCVPVVLSTGRRIAALHAGWRGIASGVIGAGVEAFAVTRRAEIRAWIGPSIGPCCYEVGPDVAGRLVAASGPAIVTNRPGNRTSVDLRQAIRIQLGQLGIEGVEHLDLCTSCRVDLLCSYRREGPGAGRNLTLAWIG